MRFLRGLVFCILVFLFSSIAGIIISGLLGTGDGQGLAAGAIVIGYGFIIGLACTVLAILILSRLKPALIVKLNIIFAIILLLAVSILTYRFINREKKEEPKDLIRKPTQPAMDPVSFVYPAKDEMGLGYFKPNIYSLSPLYLYGNITPGKSLYQTVPTDSVTFVQTELDQYAISYAPPILNPAHMKMDYELLMFKVVRLTREYAEIKVSEQTGHTSIVDLQSGEVILWPEFLLSVSTLELENPDIRIKPLSHASGLNFSDPVSFYKPLSIKSDWIEISCTDQNLKEVARGWIKWRENNQLLIGYKLFS